MKPNILATLLFAGTAMVGGCASVDSPSDRYSNSSSRYDDSGSRYYGNGGSRYDDGGSRYYGARSNEGYYGVVDSIESKSRTSNTNSNAVAGTIIGGVVGGVLGHQVGSGTGNTVATVAGAVGGAVVGHEIGKGNPDPDTYRLRIRFDNGNYQTVTQASIGDLRVGDSVRIENGRVYRY
jgi:outer membrane lipoprotein SlyB